MSTTDIEFHWRVAAAQDLDLVHRWNDAMRDLQLHILTGREGFWSRGYTNREPHIMCYEARFRVPVEPGDDLAARYAAIEDRLQALILGPYLSPQRVRWVGRGPCSPAWSRPK